MTKVKRKGKGKRKNIQQFHRKMTKLKEIIKEKEKRKGL